MVNIQETKEVKKRLEIWIKLIPNISEESDFLEKEEKFIKQIQEKSSEYQQEFQNQLDELIEELSNWIHCDSFRGHFRMIMFSKKYPWEALGRKEEKQKKVLDSFLKMKDKINIKNRVINLLENVYEYLELENDNDWKKNIEPIDNPHQLISFCQESLLNVFAVLEEEQKWIDKIKLTKGVKELELLTKIVFAKRTISRIYEKVKEEQKNNLFANISSFIEYFNYDYFSALLVNNKERKKEESWKRIEELKKDIENTTAEPFFDNLGFGKKQPNEITVLTRCHLIFIEILNDIVEISHHVGGKGSEYEEEGDGRDKYIRDILKTKKLKELEKLVNNYIFKQEVVNLLKRVENQISKSIKNSSGWGYGWLWEKEKIISLETDNNQLINHCRSFLIELLNRMNDISKEQWTGEIEKQQTLTELELLANKIIAKRTVMKIRDRAELQDNQLINPNWQKDMNNKNDFVKLIPLYQSTIADILVKAGIPKTWVERINCPGFDKSQAIADNLLTKKQAINLVEKIRERVKISDEQFKQTRFYQLLDPSQNFFWQENQETKENSEDDYEYSNYRHVCFWTLKGTGGIIHEGSRASSPDLKITEFFNDLKEFLEIAGINFPSYFRYDLYRINSIEELEKEIDKLFINREVKEAIIKFRDDLEIKDDELANPCWQSSLEWERNTNEFINHYQKVLVDILSTKEKQMIFTEREKELKESIEIMLTNDKELKKIESLKTKLEELVNLINSDNNLFRFISSKSTLDTLARFLTGRHKWDKSKKDTCVAVCYHENKLFIASNKKKPEYAQDCLKHLRKFADNQSLENFEELLKKAIEKIYHTNLLVPNKLDNAILNEYLKEIENCYNNSSSDWEKIQELTEKLFQLLQKTPTENKEKGQIWKLLTPWHDLGEIIKLIIENKFSMITDLIFQEEVICVESEDEEENLEKKKTHAELKIINRLYKKKLLGENQKICYIGSTKKTCSHCQAVIEVLNKDGKYRWESYGTHGSEEFKCKNPAIVTGYSKEKEVESLTKEIIQKNKQTSIIYTTSEIPKTLTNPIQLLERLQIQEHLFQIQVSPKS